MRLKHLSLLASASLFGILASAGLPASALAQAAATLSGQVSSAEEGPMEGVLVSAKKDGSTITTTVVTNQKGEYSFPAGRLDAGHYTISTRAIGYDLDGPKAVDIKAVDLAATGAKADIKLVKTKNLVDQLSNAEWLMSAPGPDNLKTNMGACVSCHTLQRVFASTHDPDEFKLLFRRMGSYSPGSTPLHLQPLLPGPRADRAPVPANQFDAQANWLASVNLSTTDKRGFDLKTMPRPKGASTKVIYTEYDLPRPLAQPHDVIVDQDGMVWYSDFSNMFAGELNPKTGKATEIAIPVLKPEEPKGSLEIELEPGQKNVWLALMYQAGVARIDRKTHEVKTYPFPKEWDSTTAQASMVSPQHADVDGKVWTNNQEEHHMYRIDAKTGVATIYQTPIKNSRPRRGRVDEQNRLWFAEFAGNAIGLFDPKTAEIKEYPLPTKFSMPYDVVPNKDASEVWTGSMMNDQVARLDTKTGKITEYLLPRSTNIRRVFVQDDGPRTVLWVGSNHGASIVKVEPLD